MKLEKQNDPRAEAGEKLNPFAAETKNYTLQAAWLWNDPEGAVELMREAHYSDEEIARMIRNSTNDEVERHNANHGKFFQV